MTDFWRRVRSSSGSADQYFDLLQSGGLGQRGNPAVGPVMMRYVSSGSAVDGDRLDEPDSL